MAQRCRHRINDALEIVRSGSLRNRVLCHDYFDCSGSYARRDREGCTVVPGMQRDGSTEAKTTHVRQTDPSLNVGNPESCTATNCDTSTFIHNNLRACGTAKKY